MSVPYRLLTPTEQVFFHKEGNKEYAIAVDRLIASLQNGNDKIEPVTVEAGVVKHIRENFGIEEHRLASLRKLTNEQFVAMPPILVLVFKDERMLVADGSHRMVQAYERGLMHIKAYLVRRQRWAPFIVKGHPSGIYEGFSGIFR